MLAAKIDESKIVSFLDDLDTKDEEALMTLIDRLESFRTDVAYKGFVKIRGQKTEEWWRNMEALGDTDLHEHQLLRKAAKPLRAAWRKFNGKPKPEAEIPEQDSASDDSP